jgi:hypothetical protein
MDRLPTLVSTLLCLTIYMPAEAAFIKFVADATFDPGFSISIRRLSRRRSCCSRLA